MKSIYLISLIFLFITWCNREEVKPEEEVEVKPEEVEVKPEEVEAQKYSIYGKWQLFEQYEGLRPNGLEPWQPVKNGKIITFTEKNVFKDSSYKKCDGTFTINNSFIDVIDPCYSSTESIRYSFGFENNNILYFNGYSWNCDEGCIDKYKRISSK